MAVLTPGALEVTPIQRTCLILNSNLHRRHNDDRDPRPCVRLFIDGTEVQYLLTELCPYEDDRAYGLIDEGDGNPRLGWIDLSEIVQRGAEVDPIWQAGYRLSHYAGIAALAGRIVAYEAPTRRTRF